MPGLLKGLGRIIYIVMAWTVINSLVDMASLLAIQRQAVEAFTTEESTDGQNSGLGD